MRPFIPSVLLVLASLAAPLAAQPAVTPPPSAASMMTAGLLVDAEANLAKELARSPKADDVRFALGTTQFLRGVERLMGSLHAHGLLTENNRLARGVPFLRLPVPENPQPKEVSYDDVRKMLATFADDLRTAEATLAGVTDEKVSLPLAVGMIRMDFDGDGQLAEGETLWRVFDAVMGRGGGGGGISPEQAEAFTINFDRGDVAWLRGYCHLLMAMTDLTLTYDGQQLFDVSAHLFFARPKSPHAFLRDAQPLFDPGMGVDIVDAIAIVHLLNLPVKDAVRGPSAVEHLKQMTQLSRESWKSILAETDDDREWLPNPKQQTVVPNVRVTQEMVDQWLVFLDEMDRLLDGKALIPFWRTQDGTGVNLRKAIAEPRTFDLVLWVQGAAATPFLEKDKPLTDRDVWAGLQRVFGGNLFGFAVWFN